MVEKIRFNYLVWHADYIGTYARLITTVFLSAKKICVTKYPLNLRAKILDRMAEKRKLVIKIGSNVLTTESGLNKPVLNQLVEQIVELREYYHIVMVTSGANASSHFRGILQSEDNPTQIRMNSAIGQPKLMMEYIKAFDKFQIAAAQIMITQNNFANDSERNNISSDCLTAFNYQIVPIFNENDAIGPAKPFSDNDELASLIAHEINADLAILSNVDGLFDGPPTASTSKLIPNVDQNTNLDAIQYSTKSSRGRGGMLIKASFLQDFIRNHPQNTAWLIRGEIPFVLVDLLIGKKKIGTEFKYKE